MTQEEYIKTIIVNGRMVNIGMDDYGQCYFFEYEQDGDLKEVSCGSYLSDYEKEIVDYFNIIDKNENLRA